MRIARTLAAKAPGALWVLGALVLAVPGAAQSAWRPGAPAPDLRLPTLDGGTLRLAELRGERLLLFEFASW